MTDVNTKPKFDIAEYLFCDIFRFLLNVKELHQTYYRLPTPTLLFPIIIMVNI